jgi:hypothetical protein
MTMQIAIASGNAEFSPSGSSAASLNFTKKERERTT